MAAKTALTVCLYCLFLFAKENRICNEIVMFASYFFPKIFFKCLNIICPKKKKKKNLALNMLDNTLFSIIFCFPLPRKK